MSLEISRPAHLWICLLPGAHTPVCPKRIACFFGSEPLWETDGNSGPSPTEYYIYVCIIYIGKIFHAVSGNLQTTLNSMHGFSIRNPDLIWQSNLKVRDSDRGVKWLEIE